MMGKGGWLADSLKNLGLLGLREEAGGADF